MGVGAIAPCDSHQRAHLGMAQAPSVHALDPGAQGAGQTLVLRLPHQPAGVAVGDEAVVEVHWGPAPGQGHLHRDGGGDAQQTGSGQGLFPNDLTRRRTPAPGRPRPLRRPGPAKSGLMSNSTMEGMRSAKMARRITASSKAARFTGGCPRKPLSRTAPLSSSIIWPALGVVHRGQAQTHIAQGLGGGPAQAKQHHRSENGITLYAQDQLLAPRFRCCITTRRWGFNSAIIFSAALRTASASPKPSTTPPASVLCNSSAPPTALSTTG